MPKRKVDPLGRNHQIERRPTNRGSVDNVCNFVLNHFKDDFLCSDIGIRPNSKHVYYDAYLVIFGTKAANEMLSKAQKDWDGE